MLNSESDEEVNDDSPPLPPDVSSGDEDDSSSSPSASGDDDDSESESVTEEEDLEDTSQPDEEELADAHRPQSQRDFGNQEDVVQPFSMEEEELVEQDGDSLLHESYIELESSTTNVADEDDDQLDDDQLDESDDESAESAESAEDEDEEAQQSPERGEDDQDQFLITPRKPPAAPLRSSSSSSSSSSSQLETEATALKQIYPVAPFVPRLVSSGPNYLAVERLGPSLGKVLSFRVGGISLENGFMCLRQMLRAISCIHGVGWLHCDIRPENVVLGRDQDGEHLCFMDLGLSRRFINDSKEHYAYEENTTVAGNPIFASTHTHMGIARSRRDDLESIGYTFLYLVNTVLPWSWVTGQRQKDQARRIFDRIGSVKVNIATDQLCKNLPKEVTNYFTYVRSLSFSACPDYEYLIQLCDRYLNRAHFTWNHRFNWQDQSQKADDDTVTASLSPAAMSSSQLELTPGGVDEAVDSAGQQPEENSEPIVEKLDENGNLIGGDLQHFLRHVIFAQDLGSSENQQKVLSFLHTFRFHWTVSQLLKVLEDELNERSSSLDRVRMQKYTERLSHFLVFWVKRFAAVDLESVSDAKKLLRIARRHLPVDAQNVLKLAFLRVQSSKSPASSSLPKVHTQANQSLQARDIRSLVRAHTSREIAQQLTLIDWSLYSGVRSSEFADQSWLKDQKRAPSLSVLAARFNQVSFWVATEVLRQSKVSAQARAVRCFVDVALELRELHNYNTLVAVIAGLNHSSIQRLKRCWARVPDKYTIAFAELETLLSPLRNFRNYHEEFASVDTPKLPYIAIFLRGILFTDDSVNWRLDGKRGPFNFEKFLLLGRQIQEVLSLQCHPYRFDRVSPLYEILATVNPLDEESLYERSIHIEPLKGNLARLLEEDEDSSNCSDSSVDSPSFDSLPDYSSSSDAVSASESVDSFEEAICQWDEAQVRSWLASDPRLAELVLNLNGFDGRRLCELSNESLLELGVEKLGLRKRLLARVTAQRQESPRSCEGAAHRVSSSPVLRKDGTRRRPTSRSKSGDHVPMRKLIATRPRGGSMLVVDRRRSVSSDGSVPADVISSSASVLSTTPLTSDTPEICAQLSDPSDPVEPSPDKRVRLELSDPVQGSPVLRPYAQAKTSASCSPSSSFVQLGSTQPLFPTADISPDTSSAAASSSSFSSAVRLESTGDDSVDFLPPQLREWGSAEILNWLRVVGHSAYAPQLEELRTGEELLDISRDTLAQLGVAKVGHRVQLLSCIAALKSLRGDPRDLIALLPSDPNQWSCEAVCLWLQSFGGLTRPLMDMILTTPIGGADLMNMSNSQLTTLRLLFRVQRLKRKLTTQEAVPV